MKCKYKNCNNEVVGRKGKVFCCKQCVATHHTGERGKRLKLEAVNYKGGKCNRCGYDRYLGALEFHHRDKSTKQFSLSSPSLRLLGEKKIRQELNQCDLLCANCHREVEELELALLYPDRTTYDNPDVCEKIAGKCQYHFCKNKCDEMFCGPKCKNKFYVDKARKKTRKLAVEYKGGKCSCCGYCRSIRALDFHHLDPTTKYFSVSGAPHTRSWKRTKQEIDKCVLVCANCHREIEVGVLSVVVDQSQSDLFEGLFVRFQRKEQLKRPIVSKTCPVCNKAYETNREEQKFCSDLCNKFGQRKVARPIKDDLSQLILVEKVSWVELGKRFGVSDSTIKKWARAYGIVWPARRSNHHLAG